MAKDIYVRLVRGFNGERHSRAGITLQAGTVPTKVTLTDDIDEDGKVIRDVKYKLQLLKEDPSIEFVQQDEAERLAELHSIANNDEDNELISPEIGKVIPQDKKQTKTKDTDGPTDEELQAMELPELQAKATELGVENVEQLRSKDAVIEAIKAKTQTEE